MKNELLLCIFIIVIIVAFSLLNKAFKKGSGTGDSGGGGCSGASGCGGGGGCGGGCGG